MRVALIGGAGFIGSAIASKLKLAKIDFSIYDTAERLDKNKNILPGHHGKVFEYPCTSNLRTIFAGYYSVIHLAWTTEPASSMKSIVYDARTNIAPSVAIIQAAIDAGVKRFIFSSSGGTVYGVPQTLPVKENHIKEPICAYGVSKLSVEKYLSLYSKRSGFKGISLRLGNPYGAYQLRGTSVGLIARYLNLLKNKQPLEVWGDGSIIRDYIYIDDAAQAFVCAIDEPGLLAGAYNIGSGIGRSINEIIKSVFEVTGSEVPVHYKPGRPYDVPAIVLDATNYKSQTSWFAKTGLKDGIKQMWESIK